jgi:hypothetical protein
LEAERELSAYTKLLWAEKGFSGELPTPADAQAFRAFRAKSELRFNVACSDWTFVNEREEHAFLEEGQVLAEIAARLHVEGNAKAEIAAQARAEEKVKAKRGTAALHPVRASREEEKSEEHAFLEEGQVLAEIAAQLHVEGNAKAEIAAQARVEEKVNAKRGTAALHPVRASREEEKSEEKKGEGQMGADSGATASAKRKSVLDFGDKSVLDDGDKSVLDDGEAGMKTGCSAKGAKQKVGRKKEALPRGRTKREMSTDADDAATKITAVGALDADGGLTHQYKEYLRANRLQILTPADEKSTATLYKLHVSSAPEDLLVVRTHQYQRDLVRIFALIAAAGVEAFGIIRIYGFRGDAKWEPQEVDCDDCCAALQSAFTTFRTHQYEDVLKMVQRLQPDPKCRGFIGIAGKITAWFKENVGVELAIIAEITDRIEEAIQTELRSGAPGKTGRRPHEAQRRRTKRARLGGKY